MDNMAYLQQIASNSSKPNPGKQSSPFAFFDKIIPFLTLRNISLALSLIFVLILFSVFSGTKKIVEKRDRDSLVSSYYLAKYMNEELIDKYKDYMQSSDIRGITASLQAVLAELELNEKNLLTSEFGITELESTFGKSEIATSQKNTVEKIAEEFENGRISARLDRFALREFPLLIAYLINFQTEAETRTTNQKVKANTVERVKNLENIKSQYENFKSSAI